MKKQSHKESNSWMFEAEKIIFSVIFLANAGYVMYDVFKFLS